MDLFGFFNPDQSAERGKEVNDTGGLILDTSAKDSALPVEDAGNAVPAFEFRSFLAAKFSATLLSIAAVIGRVNDDGIV